MRTCFLLLPILAAAGCTDAAATAPPTCGDPTWYRIDHVDLPVRFGDDVTRGLDLDGDGKVDNLLGRLLAGVRAADPTIDIETAANAQLAASATWFAGVRACDDGPRYELGDSGGGDVAPITAFFDPTGTYAPIAWARIGDLHTQLTIAGDHLDGVVGFTMPGAARRAMVEPYAAYLSAELAAGTSSFAAQMDTNHDGVVTGDELLASELGATFLCADLPGDRLSAGMIVHATRVAL
jgi:hypothetical protein